MHRWHFFEIHLFPLVRETAAEPYMRRGGDDNNRSFFPPPICRTRWKVVEVAVRSALHVKEQCQVYWRQLYRKRDGTTGSGQSLSTTLHKARSTHTLTNNWSVELYQAANNTPSQRLQYLVFTCPPDRPMRMKSTCSRA